MKTNNHIKDMNEAPSEGKILTLCTAAYNVGRYIERNIKSVIKAKKNREIELLIVNDGSKDNTGIVVQKYMKLYPELITYIEKKNGGAGSAWNVGMKIAKGKYFKLLDGDDYVDSEGLRDLVGQLRNEESDMVLMNYTKVYPKSKEIITYREQYEPVKNVDIDYFHNLEGLAMHGLAFRTEVLQKNQIQVSEGIPYTDIEFIMFPIPYIHRISYYPINVYMYSLGIEGQSMNEGARMKNIEVLASIVKNVGYCFARSHSKLVMQSGQREIMLRNIKSLYFDVMKLYFRHFHGDIEKIRIFDKEMNQIDPEISEEIKGNFIIRLTRKSNFRLCIIGVAWYKLRYCIYKKMKTQW